MILAQADEARQWMKDNEPERYAAEGARIRAELALCLAIAALGKRTRQQTAT